MKHLDFWLKTLEIAARYYAALMLGVYGLGKMLGGQFYRHDNLPEAVARKTVAELGGFDLAWTFFGYSQAYILFIGISQVLGALLLLSERTKLLGVAILLPVLSNIVVVDATFDIHDAMMSAIFYLLLLLYVLWHNRVQVVSAFQALWRSPSAGASSVPQWPLRLAAGVLSLLVLFAVETLLLEMVGFGRF